MMTGGGLTRRGGCIYAARNGVGWGGLKEEAIYFLSGLEMREKKKTQVQAEKEMLVQLTTQRGYSFFFFLFFNRYKCARYPLDPPGVLLLLEECLE